MEYDEIFAKALAADNNGGYEEDVTEDDLPINLDELTYTRTHDSLDAFVSQWGRPHETETYFGQQLNIWHSVQARKGAVRGDLFVIDFGEIRLAHFTGQA